MTSRNWSRAGIAAAVAKANERVAAVAPILRELRAAGITSPAELAAQLNARGIPAARGGQWRRGQVRRVLARMGHGAG